MKMNHKGTVYHLAGDSRLRAMHDFSVWKGSLPSDLKDFREGLHTFFGMPVAKGAPAKAAIETMADTVVSMMRGAGPSLIPSVSVITPEGLWHCPLNHHPSCSWR